MGAKYQTLASVSVVTDHDCGNYRLGEVEGGFDERELKKYLHRYGKNGMRQLKARIDRMDSVLRQTWLDVEEDSVPLVDTNKC